MNFSEPPDQENPHPVCPELENIVSAVSPLNVGSVWSDRQTVQSHAIRLVYMYDVHSQAHRPVVLQCVTPWHQRGRKANKQMVSEIGVQKSNCLILQLTGRYSLICLYTTYLSIFLRKDFFMLKTMSTWTIPL